MASLADRNADPLEDSEHLGTKNIDVQPKGSKHDCPNFPIGSPSLESGEDKDATIPDEDLLCEQCSEVNFKTILSTPCSCYDKVIMVSTVENVLANKKCPSCRLITHLILSQSYVGPLPEATRVTLHLNQYQFSNNDNIEHGPHVPLWIEVGMDTHNLFGETGVKYHLGSILPVRENEKDEDYSEKYYQELFSTPEHDGLVYARRLPRSVNTEILRAWTNFCESDHDICTAKRLETESEISVRFIDVQERCVVTSTLKETYLALSYVWGNGTSGLLTSHTFETYQRKGYLTKEVVPRAVFDAMELTAALGERYIWVDTACIIQDDVCDQQQQLPIMDAIYRHAKLVIIAAVKNANSRLPRWGGCHCDTRAPPEVLSGIRYTTGQPSLDLVLKHATWNSRGWTFQEGLVARRALIFTWNQVYWSCRQESWCEDRHTEFKDIRHVPTNHNALLASQSVGPVCGSSYSTLIKVLCAMGNYRERVEQYSKRRFSNYSDVVWAFVGILKDLKNDFPKGFIWALPYDYLDTALLWDTCCASDRFPEHTILSDKGSFRQLPIPSWCWIAKGHKLHHLHGCSNSIVSLVKWHEPIQITGKYDTATQDERLSREFQAPVFLGPGAPELELGLLDFGLLHFTAQAASLVLELDPSAEAYQARYGKKRRPLSGMTKMSARIQLPSGRDIGQMFVPKRVFKDRLDDRREFILLSKYTGEPCYDKEEETRGDCTHFPGLNIMLIHWCKNEDGADVAIRIGIARIEEEAWREADAKEKEIILG